MNAFESTKINCLLLDHELHPNDFEMLTNAETRYDEEWIK